MYPSIFKLRGTAPDAQFPVLIFNYHIYTLNTSSHQIEPKPKRHNATEAQAQCSKFPSSTPDRAYPAPSTSEMAWTNNSRHKRRVLDPRNLSPSQYIPPLIPLQFSPKFTNIHPAYYLPPTSLTIPITKTPKSTYCEWKGYATYYSITSPSSSSLSETIKDRIWSYDSPNEKYKDLKGYLSFYAGPWECYVDGELVKPQPGDFYGGWTTGELEGIIKGEGATRWL